MTVFTILQNFIAIKQKEPCLRRKYVDFQKMLSDPCLNIAEIFVLPIYLACECQKCIFQNKLVSMNINITDALVAFNPISTGLFCLVVALGERVFSTSLHNSFVFKVRLLKFCTELLWDRMNNFR